MVPARSTIRVSMATHSKNDIFCPSAAPPHLLLVESCSSSPRFRRFLVQMRLETTADHISFLCKQLMQILADSSFRMSARNIKKRSIRRRKRRFHGNRYTALSQTNEVLDLMEFEDNSRNINEDGLGQNGSHFESSTSSESEHEPEVNRRSATARKLFTCSDRKDYSASDEDSYDDVSKLGYRFVDMSLLVPIVEMLLCPQCRTSTVTMQEVAMKCGFASNYVLFCKNCSFQQKFCPPKKVGHAYEVNRRVVLASRNIGVGLGDLQHFTTLMNMPAPMDKKSYKRTVSAIQEATKYVADVSMSKAAEEVKALYDPDDNGAYSIAVSGDGTWRKRGYTSSRGVVSVLALTSGKVLDKEVMSKECFACMHNQRMKSEEEFTEWWEDHKNECHANFQGSSGAMDSEGCVRIFKRSVEKHGLKYVEFLGDGDSKAYSRLEEEQVYGDTKVTKLECIGHVQKRMGSRLRAMKKCFGKTKLHDGKTIGGKGRLTDKLIDSLQVYYGKAIRENTHSVDAMKTATMAIWNHVRSSDTDPHHNLCPKGSTSWCGFQRDMANKTKSYKHKNSLPPAVAAEIKCIFEALSSDSLLMSCLHGQTQNQNESFNGLIWQRAPKTKHSALPTVEVASDLAVIVFNDGEESIGRVFNHMNIDPGFFFNRGCKDSCDRRLYFADYSSSEKAKKRRRTIRNKKKGYIEQLQEKEGPTYKTGAF